MVPGSQFACRYSDHMLFLGAKIELSRVGELSAAEHLQVKAARVTLGTRVTLAVS